jgi:diguanylate cyclase (GGDEF)-like protein
VRPHASFEKLTADVEPISSFHSLHRIAPGAARSSSSSEDIARDRSRNWLVPGLLVRGRDMYNLLTVTDGTPIAIGTALERLRVARWSDDVSWEGMDCVLVTPECANDPDAIAQINRARERDATLAIVLVAPSSAAGVAELLQRCDLDGFIDSAWPPMLVTACIEIAVRHARLERNVVEIQRVVLEHTRIDTESLYAQAAHDDLTGLYTRRHMREVMSREHERCVREGHPYSVIFIDLDDLKGINDVHGHTGGSKALRSVGRILQSLLRASDAAGRIGGDEFIVFLPNCDRDGGAAFADRVRRAVQAMRLTVGNLSVAFTVSLGVAAYPEDGAVHAQVIERADRALYRAKTRGKNCTVVFGSWIE